MKKQRSFWENQMVVAIIGGSIATIVGGWILYHAIQPDPEQVEISVAGTQIALFSTQTSNTEIPSTQLASNLIPLPLPTLTSTLEIAQGSTLSSEPTIISITFKAIKDMFCYDGPADSYETHWELYIGQTAYVLAKWSGDPSWIAVDINDPGTRTDCCWVESNKGSLNVSLDQIKTTRIVPPDRMDCTSIR